MIALPPKIDDVPADYSCSRDGLRPMFIVAHATQGTNSLDELQHGGGRGVSAHRLINRDGSQYRLVPDEHGANHAGYSTAKVGGIVFSRTGRYNVNEGSLSFELESLQRGTRDDYTEDMLISMGYTIWFWRRKFGPLPILRHGDIDPMRKSDPVSLTVDAIERWTERATQIMIAKSAPVSDTKITFYRVKNGIHAIIRTKPDNRSAVALDGNGRLSPGTVRGVVGRVLGAINGAPAYFLQLQQGGYVDESALVKA